MENSLQLLVTCAIEPKVPAHRKGFLPQGRWTKTISIQSIYPVSLGILFSDVRLYELTVYPQIYLGIFTSTLTQM